MATCLNKVTIIGYIGKDPDLRHTEGGKDVCSFSAATTEKWKDKSGEWQDKTEWHRVVAWGRLAEYSGQYLTKGSRVYVEGKIQSRKWQDKNGNDKTTTEIIAQQVINLSPNGRGEDVSPGGVPKVNSENENEPRGSDDDFDDIPF
jgi:single-strand DNA-binding protein